LRGAVRRSQARLQPPAHPAAPPIVPIAHKRRYTGATMPRPQWAAGGCPASGRTEGAVYDATGPQPARPHWTEPDALIVGAGASGAAVAWRLAEAGFRVVCLDQGDWVDPAALPAYGDDWELRRLTDFNPDPNVRQ